MRNFLRYFKALHIWLLVNIAALALFAVFRSHRAVMNAVSGGFSMPVERALGRFWSLLPFSVAELCYVLASLALIVFIIRSIVRVRRAEYRAEEAYRRFMILLNSVLSLLAAFCLLWGVNFYSDDFCDKSALHPQVVSQADLAAVTRYFAAQTCLAADDVARDGALVYAVPRSESLALAPSLYRTLYAEFPFLDVGADPIPKTFIFSRVVSAMGFTGLYFPFTGESNLNIDFPAATFPATVAHELAHRRGIASEQQCNFLAVLSSVRSDNAAYRYSGWLLGYIHLSNALYTSDIEAWREIRLSLTPAVEADLLAANDYWAQYESPVSEASEKAYDSMLRSYGDELGMRSYGAVVDLLVLYYLGEANAS